MYLIINSVIVCNGNRQYNSLGNIMIYFHYHFMIIFHTSEFYVKVVILTSK